MPWLVGTAFIHSIQMQERRGMLKAWNVFLIMVAFFLSIFGTFVVRSVLTVEQSCKEWLAGMHGIEPTTRAAYQHALQPLRDRHGDMPVQQLTKAHLDQLVTDLKGGTFPGHKKPWTANSINPMLNLISRVLSGLVQQSALVRDVAALVKRVKRPEKKLVTKYPSPAARKTIPAAS